jgi:hypothetical protein
MRINEYIDKLGLEGFYELLERDTNKTAFAVAIIAYMDS